MATGEDALKKMGIEEPPASRETEPAKQEVQDPQPGPEKPAEKQPVKLTKTDLRVDHALHVNELAGNTSTMTEIAKALDISPITLSRAKAKLQKYYDTDPNRVKLYARVSDKIVRKVNKALDGNKIDPGKLIDPATRLILRNKDRNDPVITKSASVSVSFDISCRSIGELPDIVIDPSENSHNQEDTP